MREMKKIALSAITVSALIISLMAGIQNGHSILPVSPISITSPSNTTYNFNVLSLTVTAKIGIDPGGVSMAYDLDGKVSSDIPLETSYDPSIPIPMCMLTGHVTLP